MSTTGAILARGVSSRPSTASAELAKRPASDEWVVLAGLRFFLAAVVMGVHCRFLLPDVHYAPLLIRTAILLGGPPSVYGFFLVSGYSIAASLHQDAHGFYRRRFARIYPAYWACFGIALAVFFIIGKGPLQMYDRLTIALDERKWPILLNAIGLPCVLTGALGTFLPSWSLTCEFIYYAIAPILKRWSSRVLLAIATLSFIIFVAHHDNNWASMIHCRPVIGLAGFWLVGFVFYRHRGSRLFAPVLVGSIVAIGSLNFNPWEPYCCVNLCLSSLAIVYAPQIRVPAALGKVLTYLGELSYPLYLVHWPIYLLLYWRFHQRFEFHPSTLVVYPVCSVLSAVLVYHIFDRPGRKFLLKALGFRRPLATMHAPARPS